VRGRWPHRGCGWDPINLNGHTISGSGTGAGIDVIGRTDISIRGGTIRNFAVAVRVNTSSDLVISQKLRAERGIGFEDVVFQIERGTCSTSSNTEPRPLRRPAHLRRPARGPRVPGSVRGGRAYGVPEDDHPESKATKEYLDGGVRP